MNITILNENCAGSRFLSEHGLSYLIEHEGEKILFDTGHSNVFIKNAKALGVDIEKEVKKVILSHGHWDHGDGLQYLNDKILITHPDSFMKRFRNKDHSYIGLKLSKAEAEQRFTLKLKAEPYHVSDNIIFLGEIPRLKDFEAKTTTFSDDSGEPDFVMDDSAVVVIQDNSLIVITACSHAGICNIIDYAIKVTGINTVSTVIGGFHLKENNAQTQQTIAYLKSKQIDNVYPSHCTELPALVAFHEAFYCKQVKTGMVFNY